MTASKGDIETIVERLGPSDETNHTIFQWESTFFIDKAKFRPNQPPAALLQHAEPVSGVPAEGTDGSVYCWSLP